jgi:hypothetical protein
MTILIAAPVDENAVSVMTPAAWVAIVTRYANTEHSVFTTLKNPTADDCVAAKALYLLKAPFSLGGDLAHSTTGNGVIAANSHVTLTNCLTREVVFDKTIPLESSPAPDTGDLENPVTVSWNASAARSLGRAPLPLQGIGRIKSLSNNLAIVVFSEAVNPAPAYRVFAHADASQAPETILPYVATNNQSISLYLYPSQPRPKIGDFVEPLAEAGR